MGSAEKAPREKVSTLNNVDSKASMISRGGRGSWVPCFWKKKSSDGDGWELPTDTVQGLLGKSKAGGKEWRRRSKGEPELPDQTGEEAGLGNSRGGNDVHLSDHFLIELQNQFSQLLPLLDFAAELLGKI